jgi:hypothetical protein
MWAQLMVSLSNSFAQAAASMANVARGTGGIQTQYDEGGQNYDEFQLAVLQGFAHTATIAEVPIIWVAFQ